MGAVLTLRRMEGFDLDPYRLLELLLLLCLAWLFSLPVALERAFTPEKIGLRTIPLVALGSCAWTLISAELFRGNEDALARGLQGLVTGIGFVGGGAIVKERGSVHGLATAAGIWSTGAIGAATAHRMYALGFILSLANVLVLHVLPRVFPNRERETTPED